jgi:alpha-glucosidase
VPDAHRPLALDRQEDDPQSVLAAYRDALALRRGSAVLRLGTLEFVASPDADVLAFTRDLAGERLLCLFNFARTATRWAGAGGPIDLPALGWARIADQP